MNDSSPESEVHRAFLEKVDEIEPARDLYRALCNMRWQQVDNPDEVFAISWRMAGEIVSDIRNERFSERVINRDSCRHCGKSSAEHRFERQKTEALGREWVIDRLICRGGQPGEPQHSFAVDNRGREDYLDFYCSGGEGLVADWVAEEMQAIGYQPLPWPES